ncbi:MAG: aldo/keto reductase [Oscillospiraceae bacterium]|nr:aldo/keto reductase [Oscillospiraceae bacterium]
MERYLGESTPKLGFGMMRLPKLPDDSFDVAQISQMVDLFMDAGMTYFDTAFVYIGSEEATRKSLVERHSRDSFTLTSKLNASFGASNAEDARRELEISLERAGVDWFDYYLLHAIQDDNVDKYNEYGLWDYVREQKKAGLVRHWGFSFHGSPELLDKLLTEHPDAELVQLQLNYADWEHPRIASRRCYEVARSHNKPVVVMEPVKGGLLSDPVPQIRELFASADPGASPSSWAIRFAASLDGILTVLSGMSTLGQVRDNISYMKDFRPLSDSELKVIEKARGILDSIDSIPCTGCRYCMKGCPMEIPIPRIFAARNRQLMWNQPEKGAEDYRALAEKGNVADACIGCGQCESACPQGIDVIDRLAECAEHFKK